LITLHEMQLFNNARIKHENQIEVGGYSMANVNGNTLMMAIQAVNSSIKELEEERIQVGENEEIVDIVELLLSYSNAASELERAYREELEKTDNLPPYEKL